jgi:cytochrome c
MRRVLAAFAIAGALVCIVLAGCDAGKSTHGVDVSYLGNASHGQQLISSYGCGACHIVPGVRGARGLVGPPLYFWSQRTMIAGELPNTPPNLTHWIQHPKQVEPDTAMPDLGVSAQDANDIAAYLYTLKGREGTSWID